MHKALVLVRNIEEHSADLDTSEFRLRQVGLRFEELREIFASVDVDPDHWIFEKPYPQVPPTPPGAKFDAAIQAIQNDVEENLLLLRLYRIGDISFIKHVIILPDSTPYAQAPSRSMNDLNSRSPLRFKIEANDGTLWKEFADRIRQAHSWKSAWFGTAQRFFLSGGAKRFNPEGDEVDRVADYCTALEAALVPEKDYNTRRISNRAAALVASHDPEQKESALNLVKKLYEIRSRIVHGDRIAERDRTWLLNNSREIEVRVREILRAALLQLPPQDDRRGTLAELYDVTDHDRGQFIIENLKKIKTAEVLKAIAAEIARLIRL